MTKNYTWWISSTVMSDKSFATKEDALEDAKNYCDEYMLDINLVKVEALP